MDIRTKQIYSEVYNVILVMGQEYINKLPHSLWNMLETQRDMDYNPRYTVEDVIAGNKISDDALAVISLIHYNYWCETEEEKHQLEDIIHRNEDKYEKELREKYDPNNIFKK